MTDRIETGIEIADVYAAALFELATQADAVDDVRQELETLVQLAEQDAKFAAFMAPGPVDDDARRESLEKMFRGRLSDIVLNTLQVMNERGRAGLLAPLLRAFVLRVEDARGQVEVQATSATELDARQQAEVTKVAEELSGRQPLVNFVVDPDLIGGLVLQIGDYRFDNSIRWHLRKARVDLHDRANRGLGIGTAD